jgi:hypothetical protein
MAGVEPVTNDRMRTILKAAALGKDMVRIEWSDGTVAELALPGSRDVGIGDWGHSLVWPNGDELGADSLWLETLSAMGRSDAREFLEWRLANGLSLAKAADALGLSRRTVAYYSNGDRPVPRTVQLACKGWEASHPRKAA